MSTGASKNFRENHKSKYAINIFCHDSFWVKTFSHKRNFFRFVLKWKYSLIQRISDTVKVKVASHSLLPHRQCSPWNSPGQDTGVGSLFLPQGTSQTRDRTEVSHIKRGFFTRWASGKPKNTGVGSLFLLQWIFLTQESNLGLLNCRWILYQLSYQGSLYLTLLLLLSRFSRVWFCATP